LFKRKRCKKGNRFWKIKRKREKPFSPPAGPIPGPNPRPPPPRARAPPPLSAHLRPASVRPPACSTPRLPLAGKPAPPASRSLTRSLPLADWPRWSVASSSFRRPLTEVTSGRRLRPPLRHLAAQGSLAPLRPPPLDQRPRRYRPHRGVSSAALCGINAGTVKLTDVRQAPSPPLPSVAYERLPRTPPSLHRPRPLLSSPP
jgi:hypothetical protein